MDIWKRFEQDFGDKTPYDVLGLKPGASAHQIQKALGDNGVKWNAEGKLDVATKAFNVLMHPEERPAVDDWIAAKAEHLRAQAEHLRKAQYKAPVLPFPAEKAKGGQARLDAAEAAAAGFAKLSIRNPLVLLGAAVVAAGSALIGVKATGRIRDDKNEGNPVQPKDRAMQALGFAGAASVISAALLMWNATSKGRA